MAHDTPFTPHEDDVLVLADGTVILRYMLHYPEYEQVIEGDELYEVINWVNDPAMVAIHPSWNAALAPALEHDWNRIPF